MEIDITVYLFVSVPPHLGEMTQCLAWITRGSLCHTESDYTAALLLGPPRKQHPQKTWYAPGRPKSVRSLIRYIIIIHRSGLKVIWPFSLGGGRTFFGTKLPPSSLIRYRKFERQSIKSTLIKSPDTILAEHNPAGDTRIEYSLLSFINVYPVSSLTLPNWISHDFIS